jgi:hypothetical protein
MVGYNDAYNRALTAKSNALQRRKGQMIDHLNGSGRGDEESEDDYLSEEEGMEGGAAYDDYEDEYEDEMVGGSFEEASREIGGRATGGNPALIAALAPSLISTAVPLVSGLVGKLFGGAYTGGARQIKSAMMADLKGSASPSLKKHAAKLRDLAYSAGVSMMKKGKGLGLGGASYNIGGRATGGFLPLLAAALIPGVGKLFGMGRSDPYFKGRGFFDSLASGLSSVGQALAPVAQAALPIAQDLATQAATGYLQKKFGGRRCCSACKGSGMAYGGQKMSPYDLAYGGARTGGRAKGGILGPLLMYGAYKAITGKARTGGAMRAQDLFDREDESLGAQVRGLKDAERRTKEKNHALGAGGKRLYMSGGQAPVAAMGRESLYGYDNDEQGEGLLPPRNVATKGYMSGCGGAMPMYSCGGRALTPVAQMKGVIGGRATGGRASAWISHVKAYAAKHGVSYKDALKAARATYRA